MDEYHSGVGDNRDMHDHPHSPQDLRSRALWIALGANAAFMFIEFAAGLITGSLALLADAAHMLSDVAALGIALIAQRLVARPHSARHTFGLQRAEVLGAQANGVLLAIAAVVIGYESFHRLAQPAQLEAGPILVVGTIGLAINLGSAVILSRAAGRSLNMKGAYTHMLMDAAASVGVIVAAAAIAIWGATWADPAVSLAIAVLVGWSAWGLLRDTTQVLLEGTPHGMNPVEVEAFLRSDPVVTDVHHLHLWNLASDTPAMSAHIVLDGEMTLHEAQGHGERLRVAVAKEFSVEHTTFELECHSCDPDTAPHA